MEATKRKTPENDTTANKRAKRLNGTYRNSGPCTSIENHMVNGELRNGVHSDPEPHDEAMDLDHGDELIQRAGKIKKVHLFNFMCHKSLEITFNSRINFLLGRNGSGKSAVLTAVAVGLGGRATATNRGSSVKDFIKIGESSGSVTVTLSNTGTFSYRPDLYGPEIIVTRTMSKTGSMGYKLKNHKGQIVSSRKEDLQRIITALNIQTDNPAVMLNQDASRSFLNAKDPHAKYSLFIKATKIELITELYKEIQRNVENLSVTVTKKKQILAEMTEEVKQLEERWKRLQSVNELRERCNQLENELYWAAAIKDENILKEKQRLLKKEEERLAQINADLKACLEREKSLQNQETELREELKVLQSDCSNFSKAAAEAHSELNMKRVSYTDTTNKLNQLQMKIERENRNVQDLENEINALRRKSGPDAELQQRNLQNEISELRDKLSNLEAVITTKVNDYKHYRHNVTLLSEEERNLQLERRELKSNIDRKKHDIEAVKKNSNSLAAFGSWVPEVLKKIDELYARKKFVKKPIGPLGAYISPKRQEWGPAIESFLNVSTLCQFCVHCKKDRDVLLQIFDEYVNRNMPTILTTTFLDKVHDVSRNTVKHSRYSSMIDMLNISNPVVANCLIDQFQIESILLIPTVKESIPIMSDKTKVPRNCRRALTLEGDQFYPDPDYKKYSGKVPRSATYLQVGHEAVLRSFEENLEYMIQKEKDLLEKISENQKQRQQFESEVNKLKDVIKSHKSQQEKLQVTLEKQLAAVEDPSVNSVDAYRDELRDTTARLDSLRKEEELLKQEWEKRNEEMTDAAQKCEEYRNAMKEQKNKQSPIMEKLESLRQDLETIVTDKGHKTSRAETIRQRFANLQRDLSEQEKIVDKRVSEASNLCERIDTDRLCEDISEELNRNKAYINAVETDHGNHEEIGEAYQRRAAAREKVLTFVKRVDKCLKSLQNSMEYRKEIFQDLCRNTKLRMKYMFQAVLDIRKFKGEITFDDAKRTLDIVVSAAGSMDSLSSNTACLSGGERSFSTVAFITSLWQVIETPFYFLDEFDVFMDKVNRRIVLDLLLNHAKRRSNSQFVFLTPLDTPNVADDGLVSLFKMEDPRP